MPLTAPGKPFSTGISDFATLAARVLNLSLHPEF
jgi:hypothetical protein